MDGKPEMRFYATYLEGATVTLYPGTGDKECCGAKPLAITQSRKYGVFEFQGVLPGDYWFRVEKNELIRLIPVHVTRNFDNKACHSPSVGRSIKVDSVPPNIEIRIR